MAVLKGLQDLYLADDVEIPAEATGWTNEEAEAYFESGGASVPVATTPVPAAPIPLPMPPSVSPPSSVSGVYRWMVDISTWDPKDDEWQLLLSAIPEEESKRVVRFMQFEDKKRALVSRLLQRRVCFEATGVQYSDVCIERTKGGKPYMANKPSVKPGEPCAWGSPNWNFNVSHEGKFVVMAAEPLLLCGVDVAAPEAARSGKKKRGIEENLSMMKGQLTAQELNRIYSVRPDEAKMEDLFRRFWSLKEAYTKGRGDGLGFEFNRCDFKLGEVGKGSEGQPVETATVTVDKVFLPLWRFYIQELDGGHWISVARGACRYPCGHQAACSCQVRPHSPQRRLPCRAASRRRRCERRLQGHVWGHT